MRFRAQQPDFFPLKGGLNLVTPPIEMPAGNAIACLNYEASFKGGFERVTGFERFDGRAKPSDARFTALPMVTTADAGLAVGDSVNGQTSGATGVVSFISATRMFVAVTKQTGVFQVGENLREGVTVRGVIASGSAVGVDINQNFEAAAAIYRADILVVPGAGQIRGVIRFNNVVYAFRNNAGNTAVDIYKSTVAGWVNVPLFEEVAFTAGANSVDDGDVLTQGGVTATVRRVVVRTGSLGSSTAIGILVISGRLGGNFAAGAATTTGGGTLTLGGAQTAITIAPSGRFEFVVENFGGATATRRVYGCDGQNRGFEFDGTVYAPIPTGMTVDKPNFIVAHKRQLFFAFGASVQHSAPGTPFVWSVVLGAGEIGMGEDVAGFQEVSGSESKGALMIFTRNQQKTLYGSGVADWNLVNTSADTGAIPYTVQTLFYPIYVDDIGITTAPTTQNYGNFQAASISDVIRPLLLNKVQLATASVVIRNKNQYRVFFSDNSGLTVSYKEKKIIGITPFRLTKTVRVTWESEEDNVSIYFGSDDGYIYQMEKGRSFDGGAIDYFIQLAFNHSHNPRGRKQYRHSVVEMSGDSSGSLQYGGIFSYGTGDTAPTVTAAMIFTGTGAKWGTDKWGLCKWGGSGSFSIPIDTVGTGFNLSLRFSGNTAYELAHRLTGINIDYMKGRQMRG